MVPLVVGDKSWKGEVRTLHDVVNACAHANAFAPILVVWACIHSQGVDGLDNHFMSYKGMEALRSGKLGG